MKDFLSASPLTVLTGYATLRSWVKDQENAGKIVLGVNTQDKREKWLSLSVDSLRKQWTRRLTWYLVRACMFYKGTSAEKGTREFWSTDMNMPAEIYDYVSQNLDELDYFNDKTLHNFESWKPNLEMGMFAADKEFYPKVVTLSFSFNILHEETLSQDTIGSFPFGGK